MDNRIREAAHKALDLALNEYEKRRLTFTLFDVAVLEYRCSDKPSAIKEMITKVGVEIVMDLKGDLSFEEVYAHTQYFHGGLEVPK